MRIFLLSLFSLLCVMSFAQKPGYWQQEVDYKMEIKMDVESNRFSGIQKLTYINHSPDTLDRVFYHLYFNAFQPGSRSEEHTSELQSRGHLVCRLLLEIKK